jgi:flagellar assembly protein FliH
MARPSRYERPLGRVLEGEVAQASTRAGQLIADTEARIAERQLKFEKSLESTRAALRREAKAEVELSLAAKITEAAALRQRQLERASDDIIKLAQAMAERVIGESLNLDPQRLMSMAQRCINEARGANRVLLLVHPADATRLAQQIEGLGVSVEVRVQPDPELQTGDLRIETDVGSLDARVGTQLANLAAKIRESLRA